MKFKYLIALVIVLILATTFFLIGTQRRSSVTVTKISPQTVSNLGHESKFTGVITDINTGCWSDGTCSIKVGDRWVVAEVGGLRAPGSVSEERGGLLGISFDKDMGRYIGKKVEVFAKQSGASGNELTIYGSSSYYIKVLN
jgi:hypothetical protein